MRLFCFTLALTMTLIFSPKASAFDAEDIKDATEGSCNWIIEQYDPKEKVFGKDDESKDVVQLAIVLNALSDSPNDYKEGNGPFISEPVKSLLARIKEDGTFVTATPAKDEPIKRVAAALESLNNPKYKACLERLRALPQPIAEALSSPIDTFKNAVAKLDAVKDPRSQFDNVLTIIRRAPSLMKKENTAQIIVLAEKLIKLQKENGSFGDDIRANALALQLLDLCYKAMTEPSK